MVALPGVLMPDGILTNEGPGLRTRADRGDDHPPGTPHWQPRAAASPGRRAGHAQGAWDRRSSRLHDGTTEGELDRRGAARVLKTVGLTATTFRPSSHAAPGQINGSWSLSRIRI